MILALTLLISPAHADTPLKEALHQELGGHHPPACEALYTGRSEEAVRDALITLVDEAPLPSWVPMRAAGCVLDAQGADPVVLTAARRWVTAPETPGLALVVTEHLDHVQPDAALELAQLAVVRADASPRFAGYLQPILVRSANPKVSALSADLKVKPRAAGMVHR
ncbi:MAG: hypothetical protein JXX28_19700 [Deltaproteobacteria bacterium]|nr:hypothetical protein [Deltaproteobacteria bacterium]